MKKLIYILLIITLISCDNKADEYFINSIKQDEIIGIKPLKTKVHITKYFTGKHTKIYGYVIINGIKYDVNNGNTGYYYKNYNIRPDDIVDANIIFYTYKRTKTNGTIEIYNTVSELDFKAFEIK